MSLCLSSVLFISVSFDVPVKILFISLEYLITFTAYLLARPARTGQNSGLIYPIRTTRARPSTLAYQTPSKGKNVALNLSALMLIRNSTKAANDRLLFFFSFLGMRHYNHSPSRFPPLAFVREHEFVVPRGQVGGSGATLSVLQSVVQHT